MTANLPDFSALRILIVGDAMLDIYMRGASSRGMPEALDAPVILVDDETATPGGAANVAANVAALGARADFLCLTGDDAGRRDMIALAESHGLETAGFIADESRPTISKGRLLIGDEYAARIDREKTHDMAGAVREALMAYYKAALPMAQAVILSDYCKGCLPDEVIRLMIREARAKSIPVFADSKKKNVASYAGALSIKPNKKELAEKTGADLSTGEALVAAARRLMADTGIESVMASQSEGGVTLVDQTRSWHYPATARRFCEASGAGDTLIAASALAYAAGLPLEEAVYVGNAAAGAAVEKEGTATITHRELADAVLRLKKEEKTA